MQEIIIRPLVSTDASAAAEAESLCPYAAGWGEDGIKAEIANGRAIVLGAFEGQVLAGFIAAHIVAPEAQILNICVRPATESRGIGSALLEALCVSAAKQGCTVATLEVNEENSRAAGFYKKRGFSIVGRRAKFYNHRSDALLMDRPL